MKRNRIWLVLLLVLAVAAGAAALVWRGQPLSVVVAKARIGPAVELVYATGFVEARQPVSVQARITAPVAQVLVQEGDRVVREQALFLLADDEQRALSAQAAAQRRAAELKEGRTVALYKQGWMTRAARDQAVADADAARAVQETARARQDQLVVRAQIDGIVTKADVYPGELATPARVLALLGDPAQRAFRVRLVPNGAADLPLGISLEVNIVTRRDDRAVLIPATAYADGHVWTVADGRARRRAVKAGIAGTDSVQIVAGLAAGDSVIAAPAAGLTEGARVAAKQP